MDYTLEDLIDIRQFQSLQDRLNEIYSFPSAIIDNYGKILTATAWQDICTKFHRVNPECEKECIKSDQYIIDHLHEANPSISYQCPHGLIDNCVPIIIEGKHLGNFFTGQFFLRKPDLEFFRHQAKKYGFNEEEYLDAVKRVPVWTEKQLENYLYFIKGLIEVISSIGLKNLNEIEANNKIRESEEKYKTIIKTTHEGFCIVSLDGRLLEVNEAYCQMSGYTQDELLKMNISNLETIDNEKTIHENLQKIILEGGRTFETIHRHKNGSAYNVEVSINYFPEDKFYVFIRDINSRKQIEEDLKKSQSELKTLNAEYILINEELRTSNEELFLAVEKAQENELRLKLIVEALPISLFDLTPEGIVVSIWNKECERFLGWTKEEAIGKFFPSVPKDKINEFQGFLDSMKQGKSVLGKDLERLNKKGDAINYSLYATPLYDIHGKFIGNVAALVDISQRLEFEKELSSAKEKAEESDRLKTAFLQNMSHEIRTPMNAIMGFSELLVKNYNNKPKLEQYSDIIVQRCNDLLDIINDILDISKIESGQLPVHMEKLKLQSLCLDLKSFFSEYQKRINKQHIEFKVNTECNPNESIIITDPVKLKEIFINLIENALKFTEKGKIEAGCKYDANNKLIFYVSDTGIGIPKDKQSLIFERFAQLEYGDTRNYGGTGLGLSIVKGLLGLLKGNIWVESEPGKGSTFYFSFPFETAMNFTNATDIDEDNIGSSVPEALILVVEDDKYTSDYLIEVLTLAGYKILHTAYGKEAVEISITRDIDIVLMDIRLPDIDGYEATQLIRKQKPNLKIIAQTAYAAASDKQKALDAGCNDYISKPIKRELLLSKINSLLISS